MNRYSYQAMTADGATVQGERDADNYHDLVHQLEAEQLFLVSAHSVVVPPRVTEQPGTAANSPHDDSRWQSGSKPILAEHKIVMVAMLCIGIAAGVWRTQHTLPVNRAEALNKKLALLHQEMNRREVEEIFRVPYAGEAPRGTALYFE